MNEATVKYHDGGEACRRQRWLNGDACRVEAVRQQGAAHALALARRCGDLHTGAHRLHVSPGQGRYLTLKLRALAGGEA
jgi:hypothetical protein